MGMEDKIIAGIGLVQSSFGILGVFWIASQAGFSVAFLAPVLVIAAVGIAAGIGWLKQLRWAGHLAIAFFLISSCTSLLQPLSGRSRLDSISTSGLLG